MKFQPKIEDFSKELLNLIIRADYSDDVNMSKTRKIGLEIYKIYGTNGLFNVMRLLYEMLNHEYNNNIVENSYIQLRNIEFSWNEIGEYQA